MADINFSARIHNIVSTTQRVEQSPQAGEERRKRHHQAEEDSVELHEETDEDSTKEEAAEELPASLAPRKKLSAIEQAAQQTDQSNVDFSC